MPDRAPSCPDAETASAATHGGGLTLGAAGTRRLGHVPGLDGVRGLAILSILIFHLAVFRPLSPHLLLGGHLGVDLFFVLSGFLITALLLGEHAASGTISVVGFYRRRALRLYPALLLLLAVHSSYALATGANARQQATTVLSAAFYYFNWRLVWGWPGNSQLGHLWSLSIEEQFYLVWPLVLLALIALRLRVRTVVLLLTVVVCGIIALRVWLASNGYPKLAIDVRTDTRADTILVGAVTAILWSHRRAPRPGGIAAAVAAGFVLWAFEAVNPLALSYEAYRVLFAAAAGILLLAATEAGSVAARALSWAPLRWLGRISYGLYLWHFPVNAAVGRALTGSGWPVAARIAVAIASTLAVALVSWHLVERPILAWKDRLEGRRSLP